MLQVPWAQGEVVQVFRPQSLAKQLCHMGGNSAAQLALRVHCLALLCEYVRAVAATVPKQQQQQQQRSQLLSVVYARLS